ncbi:cyclic pyranopterin monophosphate synthase MoaC [Sulfodiicoccus acidiphilus]|uniref:Probable cyclic pyranopterin monophosphate synthase n=2 Tax=Sulfodiicoccus acidiphilus TaxID=1670455 RepID=A0A348B324_9CREN|nr:cyclic pyranopterin monophosphate synthase MoaC [Sulfodiicoccus acidiphilus]GGT93566.1 cyclic pyranopterin monophosphate synthase MoaC [Sulfodiicoccus acidiphilus]
MKGAKMVDVSSKESVVREAVAEGKVRLKRETIRKILEGKVEKGDVIEVSRVAGIMAAKRTAEFLPLCHPIPLTSVEVEVKCEEEFVKAICTVKTTYKTGVEMDALTCVTSTLLTVWDMVKKHEKDENGQYPVTELTEVRVVRKVKETTKS